MLRTWLLPVGLVVGLLGAAALTWLTTPQYAATVTLFVSAQGVQADAGRAYQGNLLTVQKVRSYTELLMSDRVRTDVADRLGTELAPGQITAFAQPETVLLTATATDASAERAQRIADAVGVEFVALLAELERPTDNPGAPAPVIARVVQPSAFPTSPISPRPAWNLAIGALVGLLSGYGAALVRHVLNTSVRTADELRRISGAPVLGRIVHDAAAARKPLVVQQGHQTPRSEAFRTLRTNLQFVDRSRVRRTLVVTSAVAGEGVTTTACNLAIVLAQAGVRVVLVDANLRSSGVGSYLGLEAAAVGIKAAAVGLTGVLNGDEPVAATVPDCLGLPMDVLPSGPIPPNPSELLTSPRMTELLDDLAGRYEVVLIDTPPLLPFTDACALGAQCDGVLLVVRCGRTPEDQVSQAVAALETVSAHLTGTVLTMAPDARLGVGSTSGAGAKSAGSAAPGVVDERRRTTPPRSSEPGGQAQACADRAGVTSSHGPFRTRQAADDHCRPGAAGPGHPTGGADRALRQPPSPPAALP